MAHDWTAYALTFGFIIYGSVQIFKNIKEPKLDFIKSYFFLYSIFNIFFGGWLLYAQVLNHDPSNFDTVALAYASVSGISLVLIAWAYGFYLFERFFERLSNIGKGGRNE